MSPTAPVATLKPATCGICGGFCDWPEGHAPAQQGPVVDERLETARAALLAEHEALLARVEAAEADAARYLWLRDEAAPDVWREIGAIPWPVKIDAAIDAARQGA